MQQAASRVQVQRAAYQDYFHYIPIIETTNRALGHKLNPEFLSQFVIQK